MEALIKILCQIWPGLTIVGVAIPIPALLLSFLVKPSKTRIQKMINRILWCVALLVFAVGCISGYTQSYFTLTPNVLGDSISEAKQKLAGYGLGIELKEGQNTSDDVITGQSPDAGTPIRKGLNVEVTFTSPPPSSEPPSSEPPSSEPPSPEPPSPEPPSPEPPSPEPPSPEPPSPEPTSSELPIQSVSLSKSSLSLFVGDSVSLTASGGNGFYSWSSSNSSVATVSNGTVSAVGKGSAIITVSSDGKTASCTMTVQDYSLSLSETYISMFAGESKTVSASGAPSGATVSWSSSNSRVATVNSGRISAVASGGATITAQFSSGGRTYSASCQINVNETGITLSQYSISDLYVGGTANLSASTSPGGQSVSWSSSNSSVVSVDSSGKVTAIGAGSAAITAQINYGGHSATATCSVTVTAPSVQLSSSSLSLTVGDSESLSAYTTPSGQSVSWSSSNTSVATVSSSGRISAVRAGSTTITARISVGGNNYSATCAIVVKSNVVAPTNYAISANKSSVNTGDTVRITVSPNVECTSVEVWCVGPAGDTYNYDITSCKTSSGAYYKDLYSYDAGKWTFYAVVSNSAGTYSGSTTKSYCTVTVNKSEPPSGYSLYTVYGSGDVTLRGIGSMCSVGVNPNERNYTNITIYCVQPNGSTRTYDMGMYATGTFSFDTAGTYIFYAKITNEFGSYSGSSTKDCLKITISES